MCALTERIVAATAQCLSLTHGAGCCCLTCRRRRRLVDVHMDGGQVLHPYVWSLGAFWPGLQALAGQAEEGAALHANWTSAWARFGWLPEMFDVGLENKHPTEAGAALCASVGRGGG